MNNPMTEQQIIDHFKEAAECTCFGCEQTRAGNLRDCFAEFLWNNRVKTFAFEDVDMRKRFVGDQERDAQVSAWQAEQEQEEIASVTPEQHLACMRFIQTLNYRNDGCEYPVWTETVDLQLGSNRIGARRIEFIYDPDHTGEPLLTSFFYQSSSSKNLVVGPKWTMMIMNQPTELPVAFYYAMDTRHVTGYNNLTEINENGCKGWMFFEPKFGLYVAYSKGSCGVSMNKRTAIKKWLDNALDGVIDALDL